MPFGNKSTMPARIYSYGAIHTKHHPIDGLPKVLDQLSVAHRYYNDLITVEIERRKQVAAVRDAKYPDLPKLQEQIEQHNEAIKEQEQTINAKRAAARSKKAPTPEENAAIKHLKSERKQINKQYKAQRTTANADPEILDKWKQIDETAHAKQLALRKDCGVYPGTYLMAEAAVQQAIKDARPAPPTRKHWHGHQGRVGPQIQGTPMQPKDAYLCTDTRLRIYAANPDHQHLLNDEAAWMALPKGQRKVIVWLRVHSTGNNGKGGDPVWAKIPTLMHRLMPKDASIKRAWLLVRRVATTPQYSVQFSLAQEEWPRDCAQDGACAINVGFRLVGAGLRVGYWVGTDGKQGEIIVPKEEFGRWQKPEDLQGIRAEKYNPILVYLSNWLKEHQHPDWLKERTETIAQWKSNSQARLVSILFHWRSNRFPGDEQIYADLEAWRTKDTHLYLWEGHQRRNAEEWRDEYFQLAVVALRKQYHTIHTCDTNFAEMRKKKKPDEQPDAIPILYRNIASPGRLREICRRGFARHTIQSAKDITARCHHCETLNYWDHVELFRNCIGCDKIWDQDYNAARNLLQMGEAGMSASDHVVDENPETARNPEKTPYNDLVTTLGD